jgi:tRNA(Ile)-lysidine synthase
VTKPRVAVATSGGRDSTALLHCTLGQAQALGVHVVALHVHHGLMPQADAWLAQVRAQARRWGAAFDARRLSGAPGPGDSVEAWARAGRYQALAEMAHAAQCDLVLLAHHRQDQAETWLLQALRGAGAAGLSAMPRAASRSGITWARPWLDLPRAAIEAYVHRHRLRHVDDSSNADPRFARSRLRQQLWPVLQAAFPDAEVTLAASARRAQEAAALANETAAQDLPSVVQEDALCVQAWLALTPARRRNALRAWLARALPGGTPETLLSRLDAELPDSRAARWPAGATHLRLHRGLLRLAPGAVAQPLTAPMPQTLDLSWPQELALPQWGGRLVVTHAMQGGVAPALLRSVIAAARQGGERLSLAPGALARSLKKQFQSRGVAAWQRSGPLLYAHDGQLLFVPGLGVCGRVQSPAGATQLHLAWVPDPATPPSPGGASATARRQRPG